MPWELLTSAVSEATANPYEITHDGTENGSLGKPGAVSCGVSLCIYSPVRLDNPGQNSSILPAFGLVDPQISCQMRVPTRDGKLRQPSKRRYAV